MKKKPNYKRIYLDIIKFKYPDKAADCEGILRKKELTNLDVITINNIIFSDGLKEQADGKVRKIFKAYDRNDIFYILDYQKKNNLNNIQISEHFKISRNTITRWKRFFF